MKNEKNYMGFQFSYSIKMSNFETLHWNISSSKKLFLQKSVFLLLQKCIFSIFRYPADHEDFFNSRLPGEFDEQKAGKRIKLSVPLTWETQISK